MTFAFTPTPRVENRDITYRSKNLAHAINADNLGDSRIAQPDLANSTRFQVQIKERLTERLSRPRPGAAGHAALRPRGGRRGDRRVSAAPVHNTALVLRTARQTVAQYSTSTTNRPPNPAAVTVEDRSPVRPSGGSVSFLQAGLLAGALIFFRLVGDGLAHEQSCRGRPHSPQILGHQKHS
jgi:hypothetical protein